MPGLPNRPAVLRKKDAARVVRQTTRAERSLQGGGEAARRRAPRLAGAPGLVRVKTTSSITALSGTTPGSGTGVLVTFSGSSLVDGSSSITLKNDSTVAASSGKRGWAVYQDGYYWLIVCDC